uniref:(California timema) hypothetical protein n=1 Tax=Timema californicum TaxID=61474 RepID=A0A7R9JB27_TIMCA|nr:unnamed protein product [Timema californicum]
MKDGETEQKLREEFAKTCFETLLQFSLLHGLDTGEVSGFEEALAGRLAVTALLHRFQEVLHQFVEDERRSGKCPLPRSFVEAPDLEWSERSSVFYRWWGKLQALCYSVLGATNIVCLQGSFWKSFTVFIKISTGLFVRLWVVFRDVRSAIPLAFLDLFLQRSVVHLGENPQRLCTRCDVPQVMALLLDDAILDLNRSSWEQLISLYPYLVECTTTTSSQVSRSLREALLQYCDLLKSPTSYLNGNDGRLVEYETSVLDHAAAEAGTQCSANGQMVDQ